MAITQPSIIEQMISKYSGGDDAYANKLKKHMRDAFGYSNYMARLGEEAARPAAIGSVKGLSPQGIKERISTRFNMQDENIRTLSQIAGGIDTAAGQLAAEQIARAKAAASSRGNAMGFDNGVTFSPKNQIELEILKYMQNPKNADGSVKSLQQFEAEMNQKFAPVVDANGNPVGADKPYDLGNGNIIAQDVLDASQIKKAIENKVPKDFIGSEDKYSLMAQGYSSKQADELAGALRYDVMSGPEKLIYETKNPVMSKKLQSGSVSAELINDIGTTFDEKTGQTIPKYTFDQLREKYPAVPETDLKALVTPVERQSMQDDINQWLNKYKSSAVEMLNNPDEGLTALQKDKDYIELTKRLEMTYGSVFTAREIEQMIFNSLSSPQ